MSVKVKFLPDDITIPAEVGEPLLDVANRAGVFIPTGCLMGSCHACEVELGNGTPICACISAIPPNATELVINTYDDLTW